MDYVGAIIGVLGTILGGVLSYAAFHRNSKKDSESEGKEAGTMLTEIGYIKGGIDRIGIEVRPYKLDKTTAGSAAARDWYFTEKTVDNLVEFTRALMEKYNIPAENVVRHYDVTGKWCPRPWMGDDMNAYYGTSGNEQWARFKARLSGNEEVFDMDINEARKQLTSCADTGDTPSAWAKEAAEYCKRKGIFNGDGAGNFGWQQPITREAVACIIYRALEAAGALGNLSDV